VRAVSDDAVFGAGVPRKEDARLLVGRGHYVSDLAAPGMVHAAFVRSTHAHARVLGFDTTAAESAPGVRAVITADHPDVQALRLRATSGLTSYVETDQPALAWPTVRHAGEPVAVVLATDRYRAEDAAELVEVGYEPLPVVVDQRRALEASPPIHAGAPGNVLVSRRFEGGDVAAALETSAVVVERHFETNRHTAVPIEGRGGLAQWDPIEGRLTYRFSTQVPHLHRSGLAEIFGLDEGSVRVVAPDVGGGFGIKNAIYPEDVTLCLAARLVGAPVKWVEDRVEHLQTAIHARQHSYDLTVGFDADGSLLAVRGGLICNVGAYSTYPWTAALEPLMAGGLLTGPYRLDHYQCDVVGVVTNTAPVGSYRGVARPATTFAMERMLDAGAAALGIDPVEIRRRNLIGPEDIPYTAATRLVHDTGTYPACFERAVEMVGYEDFRRRQAAARAQGRYLGIGFACYNELTGLGKRASAGPRIPFRTGHEAATVRMDPSGTVTVLAGCTSQGQGLETTMAQVVADALGMPLGAVRVEFGDTDRSLFGFGAFASRQAVIAGGACRVAAVAVRKKVIAIAAHLLEAEPEWLTITDGLIHATDAPARAVSLADVGRVAYLEAHRLPPDIEAGLEATRFYDPITGTFAAGAQVAEVEVDVVTGEVAIRRLVCVEDTGRQINPMIVDGQVHGALAQGIGGAMYEHLVYDEAGQLVTGTLMDYLLPSSAEIPHLELDHITDPADNELGVRGVGEGGTLGPPAVLANAVTDALSAFGVEINELPITPARIWELIHPAP